MSKATGKRPAARKQTRGSSKGAARQLTCFVVTGFGNKTDYATGRVLNLDKTYEQLADVLRKIVEVEKRRRKASDARSEGGSAGKLRLGPADAAGLNPITISADVPRRQSLKSVEVDYRIEYT